MRLERTGSGPRHGVPGHGGVASAGAVVGEGRLGSTSSDVGGVASGEFEAADLPVTAMCACTAMMRFFHPQMIAQCANKPGPSLDQMIDFILAGLAPRGGATGKAN